MALYEEKLSELEAFIREQTAQTAAEHADVAQLLGGKEADLRIQQRYMRALQSQLNSLSLQDFLRDFLAQVWSQVQVLTLAQDGPQSERAQRMKRTARELVLSVRDDGPGVAPERLAASAAEGRLGVRQSIVGRLEDLGGTAELTSAPGQGAEWELTLPRQTAPR